MTAYHQVPLQTLPLNDSLINYRQSNHYHGLGEVGNIGVINKGDNGLGAVKGDLLTDLWLIPSGHESTSSMASTPSSSSPSHNNMWKSSSPTLTNQGNGNYGYFSGSALGNSAMQSNYNVDYKPLTGNGVFNDLPALTEENLMFNTGSNTLVYPYRNSSLSDHSDDIFGFEQQQQKQQHQAIMVQQTAQSQNIQAPQQKNKQLNVNTQLYKTELCASYIKMGICPYGNKCQFAHGENELKSVSRPPKWRSKPCANWSKFGSCRYGNRCCFKHGE